MTLFLWGLSAVACSTPSAGRSAERFLTLQLPGFSEHFGAPKEPGKSWNQVHDGLGLEWGHVHNTQIRRYTVGFMRDSFGKQGVYGGAAFGLRLYDRDFSLDASVAPMLLYRTTRFDTDSRKLIPVLLPMISIVHQNSGIGANLTVLPAGNFGKDLRFPGLIYLQLTYRLR